MSTRRGARGLGIGAIVLAALFAWLLWWNVRGTSPALVDTASSDREAEPRSTAVDPASRSSIPPTSPSVDESAPTIARSSSQARAPIEEPISDSVVFRFEGGKAASGLSVRRADDPPSNYGLEVRKEIPHWDLRLNSKGAIGLKAALQLGHVIAVRLSDAATELLPFEPTGRREYTLTSVVDQEFDLAAGPYESGATFEVTLGNRESLRYVGGDFQNYPIDEPFADHYSPVAGSLTEPWLLACARLRFVDPNRATHRILPAGVYSFGPVSAPIGWWMDQGDVQLDGTAVAFAPKTVPIARVTLRRNEKGEVVTPAYVHVFHHKKQMEPEGESSGETLLPSETRGDQLSISMWWHPPEGTRDSYALMIYWPDGTSTTTKEGPWEDMLTPIVLGAK